MQVPEDAPTLTFNTPSGPVESRMVHLPALQLGQVSIPGLLLSVCDACVDEHTEGLLGLNVMREFLVQLDYENQRLQLLPQVADPRPNRVYDIEPGVELEVEGAAKPVAPNLVEQRFEAEKPDELWAADITYVWTGAGWLYLAVVLDLFSRRVVGWACAEHMRAELVIEALARALGVRDAGPGLVHHSDRGSQYASEMYRSLLDGRGIVCSMSAKGCRCDNAVVESVFATLKKELVYPTTWADRETASLAISEYIQVFYNRMRRHSTLGYVSPVEYEERHRRDQTALAA